MADYLTQEQAALVMLEERARTCLQPEQVNYGTGSFDEDDPNWEEEACGLTLEFCFVHSPKYGRSYYFKCPRHGRQTWEDTDKDG